MVWLKLPTSKKDFGGFKPAMIIAKTADDFNYLPFNNTRVNTSRFDVGGKRNNPSGWMHLFMRKEIFIARVKRSIFLLSFATGNGRVPAIFR